MVVGSFLTDADFSALAADGHPPVTPFDNGAVGAASVDLRLSGERYEYMCAGYRLGDEIPTLDPSTVRFDDLMVAPQQTVHVGLLEKIHIPDRMIGLVCARSSVTRLGLRIAPVFMNPGYRGFMPLTITNAAAFPITLVKGIRVAQLLCAYLTGLPSQTYRGEQAKYADENNSPSRLHDDTEIKNAIDSVLRRYSLGESSLKAK